MKVAILILAVAIVGAFAQEEPATGPPPFVCTSTNAFVCKFQEIGHHIKYHAKKLGGQLADVGKTVLDSAIKQGSSLLTNGANAVLGTVVEHLNKEGLVGKRDMSFFDKVKSHLSTGVENLKKIKAGLHAAFKKAVTKLTGTIADNSVLKKVDEETDKKIDDAVEEFNKEGKKGFFGMAKTIASKIRDVFISGMEKLREKYGKKVEERAIFGFDSLTDLYNKAKESLKGVAGNIADTFKPHLDNLKSGIAALGAKAKEHAGNLVKAAQGSFNDLKTKLSGHIDTLKGHASTLGTHAVNAVNALKEAVSSIALQALANSKDTIGDIVKTGTDAAGVLAGHVAGAVGGN